MRSHSQGAGKDYKDAKRKTKVSPTGIINEQFSYDVPESESDLANRVQITVRR